ncbi:2-succinyl-5-enolpyruvyl-6-hydroxy-3-cyclohexene-1-carboxylate synthase [Mumia flava]|uniref:2-succinyl-5-enolpyruvyl-6-hydroxy-3-cyclohexene-1-carboxylate synthase n=1 Tax=Mumia flava TaxID=1348852 RepID=A0A0B2BUJ6_9ACTN|nr:2-succinyl-5-enolpyruvyl-6-hydroxy-3-cyclohexene-1-carboxylic-acid synthase [Mumia flava]PJJ58195.1 2-succinyl-5-enolpyruvyl-6-hydroxy-3-cyclohexene-1-carboxylate synthase [Mumia flava]
MTPAGTLGRVLVDELVRSGVRDVVLAPGSRSAPLALALAAAQARGDLRLHVRIDERSAAFLALGLALGSHRVVPVVTTSGTAAANLHPAVLEASHAGAPLLAITADRPAELRGTGANQTGDQVKLFGSAVRAYVEIPAPAVVPPNTSAWRGALSRALAAAADGPVHLNVGFSDPLVDAAWAEPLDAEGAMAGRADGAPWQAAVVEQPVLPASLPLGPRTVVVAGDSAGPPARILAEEADWPLFAEPSSGSRTGTHPIATYRLLLGLPELADAIERVVVFGHPTLSRPITRLLSRGDVEVVAVGAPPYPDPGNRLAATHRSVRVEGPDDDVWRDRWVRADAVTSAAVAEIVGDGAAGPDGTAGAGGGLDPWFVARTVSAAVRPGGLLVVGSSSPIRDLDLMAVAHPVGERRMVLANRGLAGIDGTVSTAVGAALGRRSSHALAYLGDLTFLHDSNGLVLGPDEPRPDLTIVVASDDGGSIFSTLEQGEVRYAAAFERVFGTPTGVDLGTLCTAMGVAHERVDEPGALESALARETSGVRVVEARISRSGRREADARLRAAARLG